MALIKYYGLESRSWEEISDLERNLQKHLLSEKHIKEILETDVEKVANAKAGNGDKDTVASYFMILEILKYYIKNQERFQKERKNCLVRAFHLELVLN